jgi:hypothetical protein
MTHQSEKNTFLSGRLCKLRAYVIYEKENENNKTFRCSRTGREKAGYFHSKDKLPTRQQSNLL